MTPEEIKQFIIGGKWESITPEVRPSIIKDANGNMKPFYCTRLFRYSAGGLFELTFINYADASGKTPLVKMEIKGHIIFEDKHPIAEGAYQLNYIADVGFDVTPLHQGFVDAVNQLPAAGLNKWEMNVSQNVKGKTFPAFGLKQGELYQEFDLIYIYNDMLFNGSRNVDGRGFDKPENRPTNLQIPLARK